jgi:autotransporter-associated beta strand protein
VILGTLELQHPNALGVADGTAVLTLSGLVSGPGNWGMESTGTLVLAHPNNTFTGIVFLSSFGDGKTIRVDADNALGAANTVDINGDSNLIINITRRRWGG